MLPFNKQARFAVSVLGFTLLLAFGAGIVPWTYEQPRAAADLTVSVDQFARYVEQWSEPEGYFDSDNFISNETSYLHVVDQLQRQVQPGGIYLGVGPDQNFSYIVHTRPMLAVVTDIRRQNMLEHLWYKALFAMASNRLEYVSLLVSRDLPRTARESSLEQILRTVSASTTSEKVFQRNMAGVRDLLVAKYRIKLSPADLKKIEYVYRTFWEEGLDLRFSSIGRNNAFNYPTLKELLLETDRQGRQQSYLSSEERFQLLKRFQSENRLIPIVGDFAGPAALRKVSAFLKENGLRLSMFYTSNVEFYLFNSPAWARFMANLNAFPLADDAIFIRSYFGNGRRHPLNMPGHRATSVIKPMGPFLSDYHGRRVDEYWDLVKP
jgi:hypothetical protein